MRERGSKQTFIDDGLVAVADFGGLIARQDLDVALVGAVAEVEQTGDGPGIAHHSGPEAGGGEHDVLLPGFLSEQTKTEWGRMECSRIEWNGRAGK